VRKSTAPDLTSDARSVSTSGMWPFHVRLGPFAVTPVELFVLLGVALATALARRRMAAIGLTWTQLFDTALGGLVGGAVGSKLFHAVPLWIRGAESAGATLSAWSDGSSIVGGWLGGTLASVFVARLKGFPGLAVMDAGAPGLPAGFAVGKIGCFIAGCCYGVRTDGPLGVSFARGSLAYKAQSLPLGAERALPVHPVMLYELVLGVALCLALTWFYPRRRRAGEPYVAFIAGYAFWRFAIEFMRDDPGRRNFGVAALSDQQIAALVLIAASAVAWFLLPNQSPSNDPASVPPSPADKS